MNDPADWPSPVMHHIRAEHGDPLAIERLGGMSVGRVYRVHLHRRSLIVKWSPRPGEMIFYSTVAGQLREAGVPIPDLEWSARYEDSYWLILEDIPNSLPSDRWGADPEVLRVLGRLHAVMPDRSFDELQLYTPEWPDHMTDAALSCFPSEVAGRLAPILWSIQRESQRIFEPECLISGDPNPGNWGVREDGTVVLFDWERFGRGTPSIDLAITIPGVGDPATYRSVAARYVVERSHRSRWLPSSVERLARDIGIAKVWSVMEFLGLYLQGAANIPEPHIERLVGAVPAWIDDLAGTAR